MLGLDQNQFIVGVCIHEDSSIKRHHIHFDLADGPNHSIILVRELSFIVTFLKQRNTCVGEQRVDPDDLCCWHYKTNYLHCLHFLISILSDLLYTEEWMNYLSFSSGSWLFVFSLSPSAECPESPTQCDQGKYSSHFFIFLTLLFFYFWEVISSSVLKFIIWYCWCGAGAVLTRHHFLSAASSGTEHLSQTTPNFCFPIVISVRTFF